MKNILTSLILAMICLPFSSYAQWTIVGNQGFSTGEASYTFINIDPNGIPYVVFRDYDQYGKTTVMKFDGNNWIVVGTPGFSAGDSDCQTLAFDSNNQPYVAFMDSGNGRKATVMKFDGSNWVALGSAGVTHGTASYTSIAIGSDNTPYVAFRDDVNKNYRASVMKFDGSNWVYVGTPGFSGLGSTGSAAYTSLAIDKNGVLYVAYTDDSNNFKASVMKFDGSNWVYMGSHGFSAGATNNTSLVMDSNNTPYVAYTDGGNNGKATVMKFDGSNWIPVGTAGFTPAAASFTSLAIDKNDKLYITYKDYANSKKASVMTFDGTSWQILGTAGFSAGETIDNNIAIDGNGTVYVAYKDYSLPNHNITVMKFESTTGIKENEKSSAFNVYPNPGNSFIFEYKGSKGKLSAIVYNSAGQVVFRKEYPAFAGELKDSLDLRAVPDGIYLLEISSANKKETKRLSVSQ